jgi:hypothetical protein
MIVDVNDVGRNLAADTITSSQKRQKFCVRAAFTANQVVDQDAMLQKKVLYLHKEENGIRIQRTNNISHVVPSI